MTVLGLTTVALPTVGPGEVLVRLGATSVNTPDRAAVIGDPYVRFGRWSDAEDSAKV